MDADVRQHFGRPGRIIHAFLPYPEATSAIFWTWGMHGFGMISSPAVIAAFDLSGFNSLVDLGGATGHLALAARARYPSSSSKTTIVRSSFGNRIC